MRTELRVPSDLRFLGVAESWLLGSLELELKAYADWQRQASRLRLVLVEAYSNTVRHAHRGQPHLPVRLCLEARAREVALEIWDRGRGYDFSQYQAPAPSELPDGGYGWLILNRLMDRVEYRTQVEGWEGWNCLFLGVRLPELPPLGC